MKQANLAFDETSTNQSLKSIARKYVWWKKPEEALAYPNHFLAQVMTFATFEDAMLVLRNLGGDAFRDALAHAPPGVFDIRSWHFWHHRLGVTPIPPLPERTFG
jgi:hypothetical protein